MNIRLWLGTGIRIFSIFLFLEASSSLLTILTLPFEKVTLGGWGAYFVVFLYYLVAVITWQFPMIVTKAVLPSAPKEIENVSVPPIDLAKTGCALLGLYLIIKNAWSIIPVLYMINQDYVRDPVHTAQFITLILMLLTGFFLFFKNKKIAEFMCK